MESDVAISHKMKFIYIGRFMVTSFSNLVDNLTEGIHKIKCKDFFFLEHESVKENLIKYKSVSCKKDYSNKIDEELKKRFNTHLSFLTMISINLLFC